MCRANGVRILVLVYLSWFGSVAHADSSSGCYLSIHSLCGLPPRVTVTYVCSYTQLSGKRPRVQPTDGAPVDSVSKQVLVKRTGRRPASRARRGSESKRVDGPPQSDLGKRAKSKEAAARAATEERAAARQAGFDIALCDLPGPGDNWRVAGEVDNGGFNAH